MKIFEIQLQTPTGDIVYKSLVPEVHVQEKVDTLIRMNDISEVGAIIIKDMGDISDRYINKFIHTEASNVAKTMPPVLKVKKGPPEEGQS